MIPVGPNRFRGRGSFNDHATIGRDRRGFGRRGRHALALVAPGVASFIGRRPALHGSEAVSYTHLTLPTNREV